MSDRTSESDGSGEAARHAAKKAKIKAARERMMAEKTGEKGLIIVHTGPGKGKSSSAFGMILRCIAHDMPCGVVQFIKGAMSTGERDLLLNNFSDLCQFHTMGEGFTWETQDLERDRAAAARAWEKAKELIRDERNRMVLLDEINIALRYDYLDLGEVLAFLKDEKPPMTHVVLTGRNAKPELIEAADLVTEMAMVKHPFRAGIKAQAGVEF
ncbi:cob(I)yrinic acid a,c-diamide adenosyltransferase [Pseudogemmobacter humi]|uniref:Corrinoid adenosyltransferase n=1 Tax=Pseudogemmobacter humi TaxID=2483812 RepID=A0A3P5WRD7_9RHOB|nr:cob(I)yrinic acid a,c-diamide adenosyltransferase [Pseudogemmobacter humi]VDC21196.1 Cob(I)yrinic acid a,c-diamide adenosyltransferase [Pseudogemmobacter humi]